MDTVDISSDSEVTASFFNVFFGNDQINTYFSKQMIKGWNNQKPEKRLLTVTFFGFTPSHEFNSFQAGGPPRSKRYKSPESAPSRVKKLSRYSF